MGPAHYEPTEENLCDLRRHIDRAYERILQQLRMESGEGLEVFPQGFLEKSDFPPMEMMYLRLAGHGVRSEYDQNFLDHELFECGLMDRSHSYKTAHQLAVTTYNHSPFAIYDTEVVEALPEHFNDSWREYHGLSPLPPNAA